MKKKLNRKVPVVRPEQIPTIKRPDCPNSDSVTKINPCHVLSPVAHVGNLTENQGRRKGNRMLLPAKQEKDIRSENGVLPLEPFCFVINSKGRKEFDRPPVLKFIGKNLLASGIV